MTFKLKYEDFLKLDDRMFHLYGPISGHINFSGSYRRKYKRLTAFSFIKTLDGSTIWKYDIIKNENYH